MKPWRQVIHIEDRTDSKGASYWLLELDCGHHAIRNRQGAGKTQGAQLTQKPSYAPRRIRCDSCRRVVTALRAESNKGDANG